MVTKSFKSHLNNKNIKYVLIIPIIASLPIAIADATDISITSSANGANIVLSASSDRFAGAIDSLTYRGVQYVNIVDHGREMQSAIQLDNLGECYNPNEAGSRADGSAQTSSSILMSISAANNILSTTTRPAFWLSPGENYGQACSPYTTATSAQNTTTLSDYRISRTSYFYGQTIPNLIVVTTSFTVPENRQSASVEALTNYLPNSFQTFLTYDRNSRTLTKLSATSSIQVTTTPLILATADGTNAMGVISPGIDGSNPSAAYYAYISYGGSTPTNKWSCVYGEPAISAGTVLNFSCPISVGTVDEVIKALTDYPIPGSTPSTMVPIYRFYGNKKHFELTSYTEASSSGYSFETTAFHLFPAGGSGYLPLYRCYNVSTQDHFVSTQSNCEGFSQEGVMGYASAGPSTGLYALYRFYKGNTADHLITINYDEGVNGGYTYEGILGYVAS